MTSPRVKSIEAWHMECASLALLLRSLQANHDAIRAAIQLMGYISKVYQYEEF